jgi:hypothetical protein
MSREFEIVEQGRECDPPSDPDDLIAMRPIAAADAGCYERYVAAGQGGTGWWLGSAREEAGLGPEVCLSTGRGLDGAPVEGGGYGELALLLAGVDPASGRRIVVSHPSHWCGVDVVCRAPAEIGIFALHPDPAVRGVMWDGHRKAVRATVAWLEERAGGRIVAAAFEHAASSGGEPYVHTHLIVPSFVWEGGRRARRARGVDDGSARAALFDGARA